MYPRGTIEGGHSRERPDRRSSTDAAHTHPLVRCNGAPRMRLFFRAARRGQGDTVLSGTLTNLVGGAATAAGALAVTLLVTRGLGPRQSSSFFEAVALFSILTVIGQAGSAPGIVWSVAGALADGRAVEVRP